MAPVDMAMRFALGLDAPLVVGAESPNQIADTVQRARGGRLPQAVVDALAETLDPVLNEAILDPRQWRLS